MNGRMTRVGLVIAAIALAGCTESTLNSAGGGKAERPVPDRLVQRMKAQGMERTSPVMARVFKEESKVEVWKQKANGRYDLLAVYDICKWSGKLGPKFVEGDRQAPEGFYTVRPSQMNPQSAYHLAFNIGFPNAYDRANGRTGSHLMVHGACSSSGCYSMTDEQMEEIYALVRDSFRGGQTEFQIQAFPFRMTAENMARYRDDPNYEFWTMLKEGYDHFEITRTPPKVDVCEKRYVFNRVPEGGAPFSPTGACPPSTLPETLVAAYQSYSSSFEAAFATQSSKGKVAPPAATIAGLKEAHLVADWSRRRARGERVPMDPPSLSPDGSVVQVTARMARIDSPAGRRMAEIEAAEEARKKAEEERLAAIRRAAEEKAAALAAAEAAREAEAAAAEAAATPAVIEAETAAGAPAQPGGLLGGMRKRLGGLFGS